MPKDQSNAFYYSLFGRRVTSDIELPELLPAQANDTGEMRIKLGAVATVGEVEGETRLGPNMSAKRGAFRLCIPGIVKMFVTDGTDITFSPEPGIDLESVRLFLFGSGIGALMMQNGHLVLHGNAIEMGGGCIICVGESGAGKSTLAAAMMLRGHRIVADDVCPINEAGDVVPGMPRIKLWKDAAAQLKITTDGLQKLRPCTEKYNIPLGDAYCPTRLPVRGIYVLSRNNTDTVDFEPIKGMEKFHALKANTYRHRITHGLEMSDDHFRLSGLLAGKISITRVFRPQIGFKIDALVDTICDHASKNGV